jgi:hypothetical protein
MLPAASLSRTESSRTGGVIIWYYLNVKEFRIARVFIAVICIALLLLCTAASPSATHLHLAIPALVFCFFTVVRLSLLRVSDGSSAVQSISLLAVHISRAPPLA